MLGVICKRVVVQGIGFESFVPLRTTGTPPDDGTGFGAFHMGVREAKIVEGNVWQGGKAKEMKRSSSNAVPNGPGANARVLHGQSSFCG